MQALMPVNRFVHFTDWVIGHAHFAMIGFASFAAIGGLLHVWRRTDGLRYNGGAANWAFWLLAVGLLLMVTDLTVAGMVQGQLWQSETPWIESVSASQPYWIARSLTALPILAGFGALCVAMLTGPVGQAVPAKAALETSADALCPCLRAGLAGDGRQPPRRIAVAQECLRADRCGGLRLLPLLVRRAGGLAEPDAGGRDRHQPSAGPARVERERATRSAIYGREGCLNCHSQLVRNTVDDVRRFGPASQAWETEKEFPQLWGTRRIGPDLARESGKRSRDWHLTHLWNPRWVVPESNMPAHPWLFAGSSLQPTPEALDLVAYLDSLGRDALLAGTLEGSPARKVDAAEEERMGLFCDCAIRAPQGRRCSSRRICPPPSSHASSSAGLLSSPATAVAATDPAAREMGPRR